MILISALGLLLELSLYLNLPEKLSEYSLQLHHFCLRSLPIHVENLSSLEALVCGKNMHDFELKQLLTQSSLIHIFIVSGSHFLFLHKLLARLPILRICPFLPLSLYAMITLCQPPAVRSLFFLALAALSKRKKLFIHSVVLVFLSCLFSVALFPAWILSRSLLMSLMAALVTSIMGELWGKESGSLPALFLTQSALYVIMGFCLWGFSSLHPLSILLNLTLGPLIAGVLFPLALFTLFVPPLSVLFDGALNSLIWILKKTSELYFDSGNVNSLAIYWQWTLFLSLSVFSYIYLIYKKREKAQDV